MMPNSSSTSDSTARGPDDGRIGHVGEEPLEQRGLAHAGLADDQRDLRSARLGRRERGEQLLELGAPADEPVSHRPPRHPGWTP